MTGPGDTPGRVPTVRTFTLEQAVRGEANHDVLGRIPFEFAAGTVTPASEQEEWILDHVLVANGQAVVDDPDADVEIHSVVAERDDEDDEATSERRRRRGRGGRAAGGGEPAAGVAVGAPTAGNDTPTDATEETT